MTILLWVSIEELGEGYKLYDPVIYNNCDWEVNDIDGEFYILRRREK